MPTTLTKDFGSTPTASLTNSIFMGCCAATTGTTKASNPQAMMLMALRFLPICMVDLLHEDTAVDTRGAAGPPPREPNHQGQPPTEPEQRRLGVGDARIARIDVGRGRRRARHLREAVEER